MTTPFSRAPHQGAGTSAGVGMHAALLIDFDNVTMGMRSDLSKDLKRLLQSDIIKGKVTVQRAYADWRRYPQYIVPLSEASIDLIFAPAYGSSKKNATDIRMAIDGMELVFTRPEIGTFILLTGDSDFSSLVLKLKEYGKYVIGVGIQESSSDILVQNCDEYYSYTSLTGLRRSTDAERRTADPWVLVEKAVLRMADRDDVMRSDRLKQVMIELDPGFDEGDFGYSKFSRFLSEAAAKGLVQLRKLENGQYEVAPAGAGRGDGRRSRRDEGRGRSDGERGRGGRERESRGEARDRGAGREPAAKRRDRDREAAPRMETREDVEAPPELADVEAPPRREQPGEERQGPLQGAYGLLRRAMEALRDQGRETIRDSDVKRRMLELDASFDETELGFGKFSRFLRQAHDHEVVDLRKQEGGNYEVSIRAEGVPTHAVAGPAAAEPSAAPASRPAPRERPAREAAPKPETTAPDRSRGAPEPTTVTVEPPETRSGLGPRRGSTRRRRDDNLPLLLEGQVAAPGVQDRGHSVDPEALGLPTESEAQVRYLTNSYKGVGRKTAEALVEGFGENLFDVLQNAPERLEEFVPPGRAEQVLQGWRADFERRKARGSQEGREHPHGEEAPDEPARETPSATGSAGGRRTRRGGGRGGRDRKG